MKNDEFLKEFDKSQFDADQIEQIRYGLVFDLDISVYAKPEFSWDQMQQIKYGLEAGIDVSIYANPEINSNQMLQIRLGLEDGIDVSTYAKPEFDCDQLQEIRYGLKHKIDVSIYADPKFDVTQMRQIRLGLKKGLDVSIYANSEFNYLQMQEIRLGLENDIDVSIYAKPKFNAEQMTEIRLGLEKGLDVSIYTNSEFSWRQMQEIRLGLVYTSSKFKLCPNPNYREFPNIKMESKKTITLAKITDIKLMNAEYKWEMGYNYFNFTCKIDGIEDKIHLLQQRCDEGYHFSIHSDKDDIWRKLSVRDANKLEEILLTEERYRTYHNRIENLTSLDDCREMRYELLESEDYYLRQMFATLSDELRQKEDYYTNESIEEEKELC